MITHAGTHNRHTVTHISESTSSRGLCFASSVYILHYPRSPSALFTDSQCTHTHTQWQSSSVGERNWAMPDCWPQTPFWRGDRTWWEQRVAGGQPSRGYEAGRCEVWWVREEVGQRVGKEAVCPASRRTTFSGEINPPCVHKQVEQLSTRLYFSVRGGELPR